MFWETFFLALRSIRRNAMRSALTILGIVIGVAAVIIMVTIGGGATAQVTHEISSLGTNLMHVMPGQGRHGPGGARSSAPMFEMADAEAIAREIAGIEAVAPSSSQSVQAINGNLNWATSVMGTTNGFFQVRDWAIARGRLFTGAELRAGKSVCVLGAKVAEELFGGQDPVGEWIRLKTLSCQVIGVLSAKGQSSFGRDQDDIILVPIRMFHRRMAGNTDVSTLFVSVNNATEMNAVKERVGMLLRERRKILSGKEDDFHVLDTRELMTALTGTTRVLTSLLGAVAAVSLLVGGIGIMNIMLVSVTERTREIGIRLAIGALENEVLLQFLVEAVAISCFGGLVGIVLGLVVSAVGTGLLGLPFLVDPSIIVQAFAFSAAIGVVFGYFPARKAARLDPIDALRYE